MAKSRPIGRDIERSRSIEELYVRHAPAAKVTAYLLTGDRFAADDLAQEAFLRVIGRFHHLRAAEAFESYLRRTVVNVSLNHLRKRRTERAFVEAKRGEQSTAAAGPDLAEQDRLWRALAGLPPRQRAALVLRYFEDLSERQTADVLGCSVSAVRSLASHGIKTLRREVRNDADD